MSIPVCDLELVFRLERPEHQPGYWGPTLRGLFGYALKQTVCITSHGECGRCLLSRACPYPQIFEGLPPDERTIMTRYPAVPQPFILRVPSPGATPEDPTLVRWGLRLLGSAAELTPYIIESFIRFEPRGIGRHRVPYRVAQVSDARTGKLVWSIDAGGSFVAPSTTVLHPKPALPEACTLEWTFHTPVHIRDKGGLDPTPTGMEMVLAGRRRHAILQAFYGQGNLPDEQVIRLDADAFRTEWTHLHPWHIQRYSGRQGRRVPLTGVMGSVRITGPWHQSGSWLGVVEHLHLGKYTSFGFGSVSWRVV